MRWVLLPTLLVAGFGSMGCNYHPFRQGYYCAPPVYSQPTYAAPAIAPPTVAPPTYYAPACIPQTVQQCPCN